MNETSHASLARVAKREHANSLGIDDAYIALMVDRFYRKIQGDAVLGPIFAAHVVDWAPHLQQMECFWRSVLFNSGEFTGNPMQKHVALPKLDRADFQQWLALFDETLGEIGSHEARSLIYGRAKMIANSLLNAVTIHRDGGLGLSKADSF